MRLLLLLGCFLSFNVFAQFECSDKQCMIVVDSGSTGSRAYLYQYQFSSNNTPVLIQEISSNRLSPGLASMGEDKDKINGYLSQLFSKFTQIKVKLPVYYYSTGGMRLFSADKQKSIYHLVRQWFSEHGNFHLKALSTISGHQEGVYGWLAVNYLAGSFSLSADKNKTIGMMDFGGASAQIAMPISDEPNVNREDVTTVMVAGKKYQIFSKSFLGIGINELSHQFLNDKSCFANNYPLPDGARGQGDVKQCEQDIQLLTNKLHQVDKIQLNTQVLSIDKWFALGALEALSTSVPYQNLPATLTLNEVITMAQQGACQVEWKDLKRADPNNKYLYNTCLAGAYYYALIVNGYGLSDSTLIDTRADSNTRQLDWTYGVVINHHND